MQPPPEISEYEVYQHLLKLKKTKSTLLIDIPAKLRRECVLHLDAPLFHIFKESLQKSIYPSLWKHEWVTPAPKVTHPEKITDLRKISCISDFSKLFEGFIKDWIVEDISNKIDLGQYGGQQRIGAEHMIVSFVDRILKLLDTHPDKYAVIATCFDWQPPLMAKIRP